VQRAFEECHIAEKKRWLISVQRPGQNHVGRPLMPREAT
jgi:hypothetical protein